LYFRSFQQFQPQQHKMLQSIAVEVCKLIQTTTYPHWYFPKNKRTTSSCKFLHAALFAKLK